MAQPNNIAQFNRFTLALFDHLYSAFPVPVEVDVKSIAMDTIDAGAGEQEIWDGLGAAGDAVRFLAEEGFVRLEGEDLSGDQFVGVRLTLRGLTILGTPAALGAKQSLISRVREVLTGGAKEGGNEAMRQVVQEIFTAAMTSLK